MCCSRKCNGRICDRGGEGGTCLGCNRMRLLGPDFEFSHLKNSIIAGITKQPGLSIVVVQRDEHTNVHDLVLEGVGDLQFHI